jgi:signal peptidase I
VLATTGTFAFWTDDVAITGTTFAAGTLDLQVNDTDTSVSTTTLGMAVMVPGNTSAEVLTLKNNGTAPLKWTMTGGLTGTDAGAFGTAGSLALTVSAGGTRSGSGNSATCSGGITLQRGRPDGHHHDRTGHDPTTGRRGDGARSHPDSLLPGHRRRGGAQQPAGEDRQRDVHRDRHLGRLVSGHRLVRGVRELVLTAGAVLGVVGLLVVLAGLTLDVRPLVFRSGSMAPAIDTGALALVRTVPAVDLRVGDVVSVADADGTRVTHRVVSIATQGEQRQLTLQGDANRTADREVHTVSEADRVIGSVPWAGYVLGWMTGRVGMLLLGLYGAFLASVLLRGRDEEAPPPPREKGCRRAGPSGRVRHASRALAMTMLSGATLLPAPASAAWADSVAIADTGLDATTLAAPANFSCSVLGVGSIRFTWNAVPNATFYTLHYGGATVDVAGATSKDVGGLLGGGVAYVVARAGANWISPDSNTRTYTYLVVSLCS